MKASVVIITKNQKQLLEKSLPILLKQDLKGGYEIIVVDSGSNDGAVEYIRKNTVKLIEIKPKYFNFANAFNTGAERAKGEFLVRLSGDVIPIHEDFLTQLLSAFKNPKVKGTYGKYIQRKREGYTHPFFWPPSRFPKSIKKYSVKPKLLSFLFNEKHKKEITNFAGACCAVRRSIWLKRPFNEKITAGEDAEYAIYLHKKDYDIVCNPKAEVIHEHKQNTLKTNLKYEFVWRFTFSKEAIKVLIKPSL
jgi:rhamnosyltransferase